MSIIPTFSNQARIFGKAFTDDLRKAEVQTYEDSSWRNHKSPLESQFGCAAVDLLRWAVGVIRRQLPEQKMQFAFGDLDLSVKEVEQFPDHNLPFTSVKGTAHFYFEQIAADIMRNLPPYNASAGNDPIPDQHVGSFMIAVKDNLLLPALYPNPKTGKAGQRGAHLSLVLDSPDAP